MISLPLHDSLLRIAMVRANIFRMFYWCSDYKITRNVNFDEEVNNNKISVNLLVEDADLVIDYPIIEAKTVKV